MASNFAALWPKDPKFSAKKDLNLFKKLWKVQNASSSIRVGFALSKWPHLHRAYVISGCIFFTAAVCNLGSKYPYFNRAYVVSSGFGCPYLFVSNSRVCLKFRGQYLKQTLVRLTNPCWTCFLSWAMNCQNSKALVVAKSKKCSFSFAWLRQAAS